MTHGRRISVTGLGYVGLPLAVAFARHGRVIGFDCDAARIAELRAGRDRTREVTEAELRNADIEFTDDPDALRAADFHIVTVPTPVDVKRRPDFGALLRASETLGGVLSRGDTVVYESTVYPGATEELCVPVLERHSGLACGTDFFVGYSPERINPGDGDRRLEKIVKVVAGCNGETAELLARVYGTVVTAGIHRAPSIRVAEAAKVIENTQRDLNIALMNELALIFERLDIDTGDVLEAAATKWNFLPFRPGLVGGHCIGVDPYYLTCKAESVGYTPRVILAGRSINDDMGALVAQRLLHALDAGPEPLVTLLGFTFKENVPDTRNTGVLTLLRELERGGARVQVHDPLADRAQARAEYGVEIREEGELAPGDAVIFAVAHAPYLERGWALAGKLLRGGRGVVFDVKGILERDGCPAGIRLERL